MRRFLIPNPFGKRGRKAHRTGVRQVEKQLRKKKLRIRKEVHISTPNGKKKRRFIDIVGIDRFENFVELWQVGWSNKDGRPVKRERDAIDDIEDELKRNVNFWSLGFRKRK